MRKVIYSELVEKRREKSEEGARHPLNYWEPEEKGEALFHQFGMDYAEFETGAGNYSTAIIELPDGQVKTVLAEYIRFITD